MQENSILIKISQKSLAWHCIRIAQRLDGDWDADAVADVDADGDGDGSGD